MIDDPAVNWCYTSEPDEGSGGRRIEVPRGTMLGGSSSINGMVYIRGQAQDYDHWAQLGNRGWSYQDVLPIFKRMERYEGGSDELRGRKGIAARHRHAAQQGAAAREDDRGGREDRACPSIPTRTARPQEGIGMSQVTIAGAAARAPPSAISIRRAAAPNLVDRPGRDGGGADPGRQALRRRALFRERREARGDGPRARSSSAAARSTRRSFWNCPASASPTCCARWASRRCMSCAASARTCATTIRRA